ncbi:MAG: CDP-glycerol glycerophosphotransferase family protein, partial [Lachnospiraceae bacterium]
MAGFVGKVKGKLRERGVFGTASYALRSAGNAMLRPTLLRRYGKLPIDPEKMFFVSLPPYADNARVLYEYIRKRDPKPGRTYVWYVEPEAKVPANAPADTLFLRRTGKDIPLRVLRELRTSRYVFFTHGGPIKGVPKRAGQTFVNLWHGCGYKDTNTAEAYTKENPFDLALVPGPVFVETKTAFWGCPREAILPLGYPRYDLLIRGGKKAAAFAEKLRGEAVRLIFWMPTFRNTKNGKYAEGKTGRAYDLPLLASEEELLELDRALGRRNLRLVIKRHPMQLRYSSEGRDFANICFLGNEDLVEAGVELYALLHEADALVSDYSSVSVDFMLLNRPMAFALEDFAEYKEARGFVFSDPLAYMPGHHLYGFADFTAFLEDVARDDDRFVME